MTIKGSFFTKEVLTHSEMAIITEFLCGKSSGIIMGFGNDMSVSVSGLVLNLNSGSCVICGRPIRFTGTERITIPPNSSGYLVVKVDLSKENTTEGEVGKSGYIVTNNQISVEFVTSLVQEDLNNGGTIYMLNLGIVTSTGTTATYTKNVNANLPPRFPISHGILQGTTVYSGSTNTPRFMTAAQIRDNIKITPAIGNTFIAAGNGDWNAVGYASMKALQNSALDYYTCYGTIVGTNRINYRIVIPVEFLPDNWAPSGVPGMNNWGYI